MAIDISPRFTLSRRGYATDEVDSYLESVSEQTTEVDDQMADLQDQANYLEEENSRLIARIGELEDAITSETPHTVGALGERLKMILEQAEEGANDTLLQAEAEAEYIISEARNKSEEIARKSGANLAQSEAILADSQRQADELGERIEADARARSLSIIGDAELRAQRRQEQIEGWAQEVISRTQADQVRMTQEFANVRRRHETDIRAMGVERDEAVSSMRALQLRLTRAIDLLPESRRPSPAAIELAVAAEVPAPIETKPVSAPSLTVVSDLPEPSQQSVVTSQAPAPLEINEPGHLNLPPVVSPSAQLREVADPVSQARDFQGNDDPTVDTPIGEDSTPFDHQAGDQGPTGEYRIENFYS